MTLRANDLSKPSANGARDLSPGWRRSGPLGIGINIGPRSEGAEETDRELQITAAAALSSSGGRRTYSPVSDFPCRQWTGGTERVGSRG